MWLVCQPLREAFRHPGGVRYVGKCVSLKRCAWLAAILRLLGVPSCCWSRRDDAEASYVVLQYYIEQHFNDLQSVEDRLLHAHAKNHQDRHHNQTDAAGSATAEMMTELPRQESLFVKVENPPSSSSSELQG